MQSGIGDEAELKRVDIPVLQALSGGWTQSSRSFFLWVYLGKYRQSAAQCAEKSDRLLLENRPALDAPNFYAYSHQGPDITPENAVRFKPPAASWSLAVGMRPKSRGAIHDFPE
jgi:choline dehydrogenase